MAIQTLGGLPTGALRFLRHGDAARNRREMWSHFVENNTLREDSTREIDETLVRVARRDLVGVMDLAGMRKTLDKGVGTTTYEYDKITPVGEATQSMSILDHGDFDRVTFSRTAIPVPCTRQGFRMDAREIAAGRGMGQSVDLTNIEECTRSVAEKLEDTLFNGSNIVLGGNALQGYTNFSCRTAVTIGTAWDSLTAGAITSAVTDVLTARQALRSDGFSGPYVLYVPDTWDQVLDEDYSDVKSDRTLRERIMAIDGISGIKVSATLPADNAVLVQMTRSVVEMPEGQQITVVTWDDGSGLASNWLVLHVGTFALKCANARAPLSQGTLPALSTAAGIAHLS